MKTLFKSILPMLIVISLGSNMAYADKKRPIRPSAKAPEISMENGVASLALLSGSLLLMTDRRKSRKNGTAL
jgi:hypothetical protein